MRAQPRNHKRSDLAGWATYGYCASHSRYFWVLRLHVMCTPSGLPIAYALAGAKDDERDTALAMIGFNPDLARRGQVLIADKGYRSAAYETALADAGVTLIRPAIKTEQARPLQRFLRPLRQIIESVNQTLKAQLDLERPANHQRRVASGWRSVRSQFRPTRPTTPTCVPRNRGRRGTLRPTRQHPLISRHRAVSADHTGSPNRGRTSMHMITIASDSTPPDSGPTEHSNNPR